MSSFQKDIKPYFTPCYRAHMLKFGTKFDLWLASDAQAKWQDIFDEVEAQNMPQAGCPEGVWDAITRAQFLKDFQAWNDGGFQP